MLYIFILQSKFCVSYLMLFSYIKMGCCVVFVLITAMHFNQQWIFKLCTTRCDKKSAKQMPCGYVVMGYLPIPYWETMIWYCPRPSACPFRLFVPKYLDQMSRWCDMMFVLPNPAKRSVSRKLCANMNKFVEGLEWGIMFTRVSQSLLPNYLFADHTNILLSLKRLIE